GRSSARPWGRTGRWRIGCGVARRRHSWMRERYFLSDLSLSDVSDLSGLSDLTAFLTVPAALLAPSVMAFSIGVITFWMALPVSWTPLSILSLVVCSSADD